jgi:hypothetical protein
MKKLSRTLVPLCAVAIAGVIAGVLTPANAKIITNVPPDISAMDIKAVVVEDFEGDLSGWTISTTPKKFNTNDQKKKEKDPVITAEMKQITGAPADLVTEKWSSDNKGTKKEKILGVYFQFRYPGYNQITLVPPTLIPPAPQGQPQKGLRLPGRVRALSVWMHSRGKEYSLEAIVRDYTGNTHILKFGSLNFVGWKPIKVMIPENIPQSIESYPQTKTLVLDRFIIRSSPNENTEEAFFAIDQLKVLTESWEVNFDGQDLDKAFKGESGQPKQQPAGQQTPK